MKEIYHRTKQWVRETRGATIIEYALLAGIVSIAAVAALRTLGPAVLELYNMVVEAVLAA